MSAIEFKQFTLCFDKRIIIQDFTATLNQGEFVGIFGPNGAGKSTLLRSILGLIPPTAGSILLLGKPAQRGHSAIGYLPQTRQSTTSHYLTARAYIKATLNATQWGFPLYSKTEKKQIDEVIELVGIEKFVNRPYSQLSGGEKQRVSLAQALLNHPKILLLDEPLSGLDPGQQEKMVSLIKNIQQELKMTVLFTAHEVNPLLNAMDRIIYLAHSRAAMGSVDEVITSEKLSWLYDAPIDVIRLDNQLFVIHKNLGTNVHEHNHPHC